MKGCVSSLGGGSHLVSQPPALAPHSHSTPRQSPKALPLLQRTPQPLPGCARVLFVTERIIRIMATRPAATVVLPGPRAPLAPRRFGAPYACGSRGSSEEEEGKQNKTNPGRRRAG